LGLRKRSGGSPQRGWEWIPQTVAKKVGNDLIGQALALKAPVRAPEARTHQPRNPSAAPGKSFEEQFASLTDKRAQAQPEEAQKTDAREVSETKPQADAGLEEHPETAKPEGVGQKESEDARETKKEQEPEATEQTTQVDESAAATQPTVTTEGNTNVKAEAKAPAKETVNTNEQKGMVKPIVTEAKAATAQTKSATSESNPTAKEPTPKTTDAQKPVAEVPVKDTPAKVSKETSNSSHETKPVLMEKPANTSLKQPTESPEVAKEAAKVLQEPKVDRPEALRPSRSEQQAQETKADQSKPSPVRAAVDLVRAVQVAPQAPPAGSAEAIAADLRQDFLKLREVVLNSLGIKSQEFEGKKLKDSKKTHGTGVAKLEGEMGMKPLTKEYLSWGGLRGFADKTAERFGEDQRGKQQGHRDRPVTESVRTIQQGQAANNAKGAEGARAPAEQAAMQAQVIPAIIQQMDRLRKTGKQWVRFKLAMDGGRSLTMQLKVDNRQLQLRFESESTDILEGIENTWATLTHEARERGFSLTTPQFSNHEEPTKMSA